MWVIVDFVGSYPLPSEEQTLLLCCTTNAFRALSESSERFNMKSSDTLTAASGVAIFPLVEEGEGGRGDPRARNALATERNGERQCGAS